MSDLRVLTVVALMSLLPGMLVAQLPDDHPGYFPIEALGILPDESLNLEVNLTGAMLRFIARATSEEDPEFSGMMEQLVAIRVRSSELEDLDVAEVRAGIRDAARRLADAGWQSMVVIREDDEETYLYVRELDGEMQGLTVLSLESEEAMLINLVGRVDPEALGSLARGLDLPQLQRSVERSEDGSQGDGS